MIVPFVPRETNNAKGPLEAEGNEALAVVGVVGEEEEDQETTRYDNQQMFSICTIWCSPFHSLVNGVVI